MILAGGVLFGLAVARALDPCGQWMAPYSQRIVFVPREGHELRMEIRAVSACASRPGRVIELRDASFRVDGRDVAPLSVQTPRAELSWEEGKLILRGAPLSWSGRWPGRGPAAKGDGLVVDLRSGELRSNRGFYLRLPIANP